MRAAGSIVGHRAEDKPAPAWGLRNDWCKQVEDAQALAQKQWDERKPTGT